VGLGPPFFWPARTERRLQDGPRLLGFPVESTTAQIRSLTEPIAQELGLEVLEVEVAGDSGRRLLRIYLDSPEPSRPVSVDDCTVVSRQLGDVLEAHDAMAGRYMLEVSSPGVNRPLRKREHFERVVGGRIRARLRVPDGTRRTVIGRLTSLTGDTAELETDEGDRECFSLDDVDRANFEFEFEQTSRPRRPKRR
jgi:ribosome maturation factor RimP